MQILTNQKQRELKDHGTFAFPVNVSHENLFSYERFPISGTGIRRLS